MPSDLTSSRWPRRSARALCAALVATVVLTGGAVLVAGPATAQGERPVGVYTETFVDRSRPTPASGGD
ncbi:MAG: hypothetical protein R6X23_02340, partial [Acidimicrobiia bacterium]